MIKFQVGDLVRLDPNAEGYKLITDELKEEVGLVIKFVTGHSTWAVGGKPIVHRDWYEVLFSKTNEVYNFEEWEIELV
jgi:hypothetical protein